MHNIYCNAFLENVIHCGFRYEKIEKYGKLCLGLQDYFYAGYVSIVLVAVSMVMGKIAVKRYVQ